MANRQLVYPQQTPYDIDILSTNKDIYIGLGRYISAVLGETVEINGLEAIPTSPTSLAVKVTNGEIYILEETDPVAYGSLGTDSTMLMKQGIYFSGPTYSTPAPGTVGFSIDYLIQVKFEETQTDLQDRDYFNPTNPNAPIVIPSLQLVQDAAVISIKAGTAAATGTQVPPSPDADNYGLWVITVANGQTTVESGDIFPYGSAPYFIIDKLKDKITFAQGDARYALKGDGFTTGDYKFTINPTAATGWVVCNDGTIGSAASGASYANADTIDLFFLIWAQTSDAICPIFTSGGGASSRGVSAASDFAANKRLSLTKVLGRVIASQGTPSTGGTGYINGEIFGGQDNSLTLANLAPHSHGTGIGGAFVVASPTVVGTTRTGDSPADSSETATTDIQGSGDPFNIMQPTVFSWVHLKL